MRKALIVAACVAAGAAVAFTQYVHRGYVGAVDAGGSVRIMGHGLHARAPWQRVTFYPIRSSETAIKSSTEGPQGKIDFDLLLTISVCPDRVASLHTSYRGRHVETLVVPLVADFLKRRGGASQERPGSSFAVMEKDLVAHLNLALAPYGISACRADFRSYEVAPSPDDQ